MKVVYKQKIDLSEGTHNSGYDELSVQCVEYKQSYCSCLMTA
jgi:hypothetical protein